MSKELYNLICRCNLDPTTKAVAKELAWFANASGEDIFPSVETLARRTGYTRRTIQKGLRKLEAIELICAVTPPSGGRWKSTEYKFDMCNLDHFVGSESVTDVCWETAHFTPGLAKPHENGEPYNSKTANHKPEKGEARTPEQDEQEVRTGTTTSTQDESLTIDAKKWTTMKQLLAKRMSPKEWKLWVRPAKLLRVIKPNILQIAFPAQGSIIAAAQRRKAEMCQLAIAKGYGGLVMTVYPDDWQCEQLEQRFGIRHRPHWMTDDGAE